MLARCCDKNEMGIKFEYTAPGTPQQNRVVERAFVTLIGRGRAMMNHAGFKESNGVAYPSRNVITCLLPT